MCHHVAMANKVGLILLCVAAASAQGIFESHGDVGITPVKGSVEFNPSAGEYRVTGGGANVWAAADAFHFAWRRLSGDFTITADVKFIGAGTVAHRKAMLMVRQSLEPDAAYADIARHGDGLTALQFRPKAKAEVTEEMRSAVTGPIRLRLQRRGNEITIAAGKPGEALTPTGPATVILQDPVYAGIGVCSHDASLLETAVFSNVAISQGPPRAPQPRYRSRISIYDLKTGATRVLYTSDDVFEAPNWTVDGRYLLVNSGGNLYKLAVDAQNPQPEKLDVGSDVRCNNDHGYTRDGRMLAFSASLGRGGSEVFIATADGRDRRQVTNAPPSYFHGWSPDSKWITIVAQRNNNFDLFRIPATGGAEQRLTSDPAYDDGPDYSPDGKWIYFNSNRAKTWDIWRMPADGAGPDDTKAERVTSDDLEDWFPHPSPNGKSLVFLSFPKGTENHNGKMDIELRMISMPGRKVGTTQPKTLVKIYGGQGTINVNSWAPDSRRFAFVSYEPR
jgi:TolB protein